MAEWSGFYNCTVIRSCIDSFVGNPKSKKKERYTWDKMALFMFELNPQCVVASMMELGGASKVAKSTPTPIIGAFPFCNWVVYFNWFRSRCGWDDPILLLLECARLSFGFELLLLGLTPLLERRGFLIRITIFAIIVRRNSRSQWIDGSIDKKQVQKTRIEQGEDRIRL